MSLTSKIFTWYGDMQEEREKQAQTASHVLEIDICLDSAAHIITDSREHFAFWIKIKNEASP